MAKAFRYALKHSLPILISYIPVALAYGCRTAAIISSGQVHAAFSFWQAPCNI